MKKLTSYNAEVKWNGFANDPQDDGIVKLPDGRTETVHRYSTSSWVPVKNGPFFTGSTYYTLDTPTGPARFETWDDLLQNGLGLTKDA
jgi:hypothetical protein